ncbi:MAG: T9SS type A sorting domain-containing protein [Flavobacteriales bacterium]|nr:T9SS type A sorting domain-containing protein [Flavobacteriales bacterium]
MRKHVPLPTLFLLALSLPFFEVQAQCPFDPTVLPPDLILCPNEQAVLATQVYDSYQWYKDDAPVPGATDPGFLVDAFQDAGSNFSVEATLDGCTERSPNVLVDGWVFLPISVISAGAEPLYFTQNGPVYCSGDTLLLVLNDPYDTNIQWTMGFDNLPIPGATNDTLLVLEAGQYSVRGAPSLCPLYMQDLGFGLTVQFIPPTQPTLLQNGGSLCADPPGLTYQWSVDGVPLDGLDTECIDPVLSGAYTVDVTYEVDCSIPSEPLIVTGISHHEKEDLVLFPNPTTDAFTIRFANTAMRTITVRSVLGQLVKEMRTAATNIAVELPASGVYEVVVLEEGRVAVHQVVKR